MTKATKIAIGILIIAVCTFATSFLIPAPNHWNHDIALFQWSLANSVLYTSLHVGAAILFLIGITVYKATLRSAFLKVASGIILAGAGLAQIVLLDIFNLLQTPWVQYGGVMLPFVIAGLAIYFGVRSAAQLVGIESRLTNIYFVFGCTAISIGISTFIPHTNSALPEFFFDISNAISVWDVALYAFSFLLVVKIKSHIGAHYVNAIGWLAIGLIGSVVITVLVLLGTYAMGKEPNGYWLDIIVIISGLLYLKAGHSFAKTKEL